MTWGSGSWGSSPWGAGAGADFGLALQSVVAVRENVVRLTFNKSVYFSGILDPNDASRIENYAVRENPDSFGMNEQAARPVRVGLVSRLESLRDIDVTLDRPMTPWPSEYAVTVNNLFGVDGTPLVPGFNTLHFQGLFRGIATIESQNAISNADVANPQNRAAAAMASSAGFDTAVLGSFAVDDSGDYAMDSGLTGIKKRIFRRLSTVKGRFAHLPTYGVGIPGQVKQLSRAGTREKLAADAEAQIKLEPEVEDASVRVVNSTVPGMVILKVLVRTKTGTATMDLPISLTGGT